MCLILLAHNSHPHYPLLVAANRDEYHQRPATTAAYWPEHPELFAGRDLQAGGTWLGSTRTGRFAAITNHRNPATTPDQPRTRGLLTLDFLRGRHNAQNYLQLLADSAHEYAGFNLLLRDETGLYYFSNIEPQICALPAGVYGLSNALLDTPWPKLEAGRQRLKQLLQHKQLECAQLEAVVSDRATAADKDLPNTGVGIDAERMLSAQFILSPEYGTRATTSLMLDSQGKTTFRETCFDSHGQQKGLVQETFAGAPL
jgi:uncharacterized protein with NRDE domain